MLAEDCLQTHHGGCEGQALLQPPAWLSLHPAVPGGVLHLCSTPCPLLLLTSQLRILFHRIWNSTSPRRALPSFCGAEGQGESSQQSGGVKAKPSDPRHPRQKHPGHTSLWCPQSKTNWAGLVCSERGCCRNRLEKGSELLLYPYLTPQLRVLVQSRNIGRGSCCFTPSSSTAGQDGLGGKKPNSPCCLPGGPQRLGGITACQVGEPTGRNTGSFIQRGRLKA